MNLYTTLMIAADCIDAAPERFEFHETGIPHFDCGSPACALGWIGMAAGFLDPKDKHGGIAVVAGHKNDSNFPPERSLLGVTQREFYNRMDELTSPDWIDKPHKCATGLRLYAEKYHGHEKPVVAVPNWRAMMAAPVTPEHVKSEDACHV